MGTVYFIYPLDTEQDRWFWALWSHEAALITQYAPRDYGVSAESPQCLLQQILGDYPTAQPLMISGILSRDIYRRVRRAELPWDVQQQIRETLAQQRQARETHFERLGFSVEHQQTPAAVKRRYRELARRYHPDNGGSAALFMGLKQAYSELMRRFV